MKISFEFSRNERKPLINESIFPSATHANDVHPSPATLNPDAIECSEITIDDCSAMELSPTLCDGDVRPTFAADAQEGKENIENLCDAPESDFNAAYMTNETILTQTVSEEVVEGESADKVKSKQ